MKNQMKNQVESATGLLTVLSIFIVLFIMLITSISFIPLVYAGSAVKLFDTQGVPQGLKIDGGRIGLGSCGNTIKTWWDSTTTDGTMHEIVIPENVECRAVLIQVVSTNTDDFDSSVGFHYSSTGGEDFVKITGGIILSVRKESGSLGFIRAAAGYRVAILVL